MNMSLIKFVCQGVNFELHSVAKAKERVSWKFELKKLHSTNLHTAI